jgi:hypothetical protein
MAAELFLRVRAIWRTARQNGQRWQLAMRLLLLNGTGGGLTAAVFAAGWLDELIRTDTTHLSLLIALVFLAGLALCGRQIIRTDIEIDRLDAGSPPPRSPSGRFLEAASGGDAGSRASLAANLRLELASRLGGIRHIANSLVMLGLIGTVVGFIMALGGVDPATAGEVRAIAPMVTGLVAGMSTALYTTLVGSVLNIWLMLACRLLEGGLTRLLVATIARGERHGRA